MFEVSHDPDTGTVLLRRELTPAQAGWLVANLADALGWEDVRETAFTRAEALEREAEHEVVLELGRQARELEAARAAGAPGRPDHKTEQEEVAERGFGPAPSVPTHPSRYTFVVDVELDGETTPLPIAFDGHVGIDAFCDAVAKTLQETGEFEEDRGPLAAKITFTDRYAMGTPAAAYYRLNEDDIAVMGASGSKAVIALGP